LTERKTHEEIREKLKWESGKITELNGVAYESEMCGVSVALLDARKTIIRKNIYVLFISTKGSIYLEYNLRQ